MVAGKGSEPNYADQSVRQVDGGQAAGPSATPVAGMRPTAAAAGLGLASTVAVGLGPPMLAGLGAARGVEVRLSLATATHVVVANGLALRGAAPTIAAS